MQEQILSTYMAIKHYPISVLPKMWVEQYKEEVKRMLRKKPTKKGKWAAKSKGAKIMCKAKVERMGSSAASTVPWETPFIVFSTPWGNYRWQSDKIDDRKYREGDTGDLSAFVRPEGKNLYRVSFDTEG